MKYYTMKECFEACGDDDWMMHEDKNNRVSGYFMFKKKDINNWSFDGKTAISTKWQIKRAEPVVLSAEDMRFNHGIFHGGHAVISDVERYGEAMDKNGQLREWQRPEQVELRESAKTIKHWHDVEFPDCQGMVVSSKSVRRLWQALNNLKQPE